VLVDAMVKRVAFVCSAVAELELDVEVIETRAEEMGRDPRWAGQVDVVVARSLAAPAVAAEYAAPLLKLGGTAVIAEPPGGAPDRWPTAGLALLGLRRGHSLYAPTATLQVLEQTEACPDRFPRRVGVAAKRPLF
jgi:16S rRNA (guanine527-N7)-methyltransferase